MIKEILDKIFSSNYPKYRGQGISNGPVDFFKQLEDEINKLKENFEVEKSIGKGRWNTVPWIRIYDKEISPSAQSGVYVVYLFDSKGECFYLTLNQGTTNTDKDKRLITKKSIQNTIKQDFFLTDTSKMDIGDNKDYKDSTIFYKKYQKQSLPSDDDFKHDLKNMLTIYNSYCNDVEISKDKNINLAVSSENFFQSSTATAFTLTSALESPSTLRYIRSLLAKPFAILTGNSGTGKTRIALNLAKYLEKTSTEGNHKNSLLIPVGADWTDNTKLLGFYNPMTHRYQSTATLDFILNSQKNPDIPFFLILDEMNLSHVERYFSDFLSAMESGENIPLYKKDDDCKEEVIPESIELPKNLFVTGTVNIDETTYMFSPKVLDRANVIEFKPEMKDVLNLFSEDSKNAEVEIAEPGVAEAFLKVSETVRNSQLADYSSIPFNDAKETLKSLYELLEKSGFEFAFRTVKEIRHYIIATYELTVDKKSDKIKEILDEQIVQKILPKIHGNRKQIGSLLDELEKVCTKTPYNLSNEKIIQMKNRLEKSQYASFI